MHSKDLKAKEAEFIEELAPKFRDKREKRKYEKKQQSAKERALRGELEKAKHENERLQKRLESEVNKADIAIEELKYKLRVAEEQLKFNARAAKLSSKRKHFIVIAFDEPYFNVAYGLIRNQEKADCRWTEEDEAEMTQWLDEWQKIHGVCSKCQGDPSCRAFCEKKDSGEQQ